MPQAGDSFVVELRPIHLNWGTIPDRRTTSRNEVRGEGYIPIPREYARQYQIFNSNNAEANVLYTVTCLNGAQIQGQLLAQGASRRGDIYAKNFSVQNDLKAIGNWFISVEAQPGGHVEVCFLSENELTIRYY